MSTLGELAVGSIVKMNVNGTARNFIVIHQGRPSTAYNAACDGTWLLMEDIYIKQKWDGTNNSYSASDAHNYLNNTFLGLLDAGIQESIIQVRVPYIKGTGSEGSISNGNGGLSTRIFLLSYTEMGLSGNTNAPTEGVALSYFDGAANSKRIAKYDGSNTTYFLRSPNITGTVYVMYVQSTGGCNSASISSTFGYRPAMILPSTLKVKDDFVVAGGAITGQVNIGGTVKNLTGEGYINVVGTLKPLASSQINIGGVLKPTGG